MLSFLFDLMRNEQPNQVIPSDIFVFRRARGNSTPKGSNEWGVLIHYVLRVSVGRMLEGFSMLAWTQ